MEACEQSPNTNEAIYQIKIKGRLDEHWSSWFNCMSMAMEGDFTLLTGVVTDQAKLRGILSKVWDLNLQVISVFQIERTEDSLHKNEEVEHE